MGEESHTFAEAVVPLLVALSSYLALGDSLPNARVEAGPTATTHFTNCYMSGWTQSCRTAEAFQLKDMPTCSWGWGSQHGWIENHNNQVLFVMLSIFQHTVSGT